VNIWLALLLGLVTLIAVLTALSLLTGLIYWAVVAAVVGWLILAAVRSYLPRRRVPRGPGRVARARGSRSADRALRELKRTLDPDRRRENRDA
jgi:hypothetical protein